MRTRPVALMLAVVLGFLLTAALRTTDADPANRLPRNYRLADLIRREQATAEVLRADVERVRGEVEELLLESAGRQFGASTRRETLQRTTADAGLAPVAGAGLVVVLDDSSRDESPSGNINDLVIHSEDVQAVVNALWRSGAEAIAINGQRLVSTSAVLCVGNTLLLNGTVHSPPYEVHAIGAARDRFDTDRLVRRLRADAHAFGLRFSVERQRDIEVPAYGGATAVRYARIADR